MNKFIKSDVIPAQRKKLRKADTVDVSYTEVNDRIDSVVKYFKIQPQNGVKKINLILMGCNITDEVAFTLVGLLLSMEHFEIDMLNLSLNHISDVGCKHLQAILLADKKCKKIDLKQNIKIGTEGLKLMIKAIKKNTHINELDFSICSIDLAGSSGWSVILDDLSANCSLTSLNLEGNSVNEKFLQLLDTELQQNKSITEIIIPSITQKAEQKKERALKRKQSKLLVGKDLGGFTATGTLNLGKYGRNKNMNIKNLIAGDIEKQTKGTAKDPKRKGVVLDLDDFNKIDELSAELSESVNSSDDESMMDGVNDKNGNQIQKLTLRGKNLTSLDFLAKFMRENPNIGDIDLGDNPLTDKEMQKFSTNVMNNNQAIRNIGMDGIKNLKSGTKTIIQRELDKNQ